MQETIYGIYRNFGGIHVATRLEVKIDGKPYRKQELTEFKILDKVEPSTFATPEDAGGPEREANTVPGPETDKLLPATAGYVLFAFGADQPEGLPAGDIVALRCLVWNARRATEARGQSDRYADHSCRERPRRRGTNRIHRRPFGPKEMLSLKLATVNADEFQTVVASIHPRTHISFGRVGKPKRGQPR